MNFETRLQHYEIFQYAQQKLKNIFFAFAEVDAIQLKNIGLQS